MTAQQKTTNLSVEEALKILKEFSCVQIKTVKSNIESEQLRQALLLVTSLSDRENLGICAKDTQEGFTALLSYLKAFGYDFNFEKTSISEIQGAVYIKFNTQKMSYYIRHLQNSNLRGEKKLQ
jgi:hypothetical protein